MIDPDRISQSLTDQTRGSLPAGLGAGGLAARHQRRVRRRRAAGATAVVAALAGGAFVLPDRGADEPTIAETVAETPQPPTTEDPIKVEEAAEGAEAQDEALADGEVTEAEYEEAVAEFRACTERVDEAECYDFHLVEIDDLLAQNGGAAAPTTPDTEAIETILVPGGAYEVTSVMTFRVEPDPRLIALATTEFGASGPLLRISLDYGQVIDAPDGITEFDTPGQATVFITRIDGVDIAVEGIGVDSAIIEAVAQQITVVDGMVVAPAEWPAGFTRIADDAGAVVQELITTVGPTDLSVIATNGATLHAQDAIAGTRARTVTERVTEIGLVTDSVTFIANGDRLYLVYTDAGGSDAAVGALEPVGVDQLRAELGLGDRAATYDAWFAATPLPPDHDLATLRDGLTIDVGIEGVGAHASFQCAWIERWVSTGDPADLEPLALRDTWPTAEYLAALPEGERAVFDIAELLDGSGTTEAERAVDPAAQICQRVG